MGRVLAIDFGLRRTGIAVSDQLKMIAGRLAAVETKELMQFLATYIAKETVDEIVIGLPKQMNNSDSQIAPQINAFEEKLKLTFPSITIKRYDERFTSKIAQRTIIESGVSKSKRRNNKGLVDEVSATIILQSYLEFTYYNSPLK